MLVSNLKGWYAQVHCWVIWTLFTQVCRLSNSKSWKSSGNGSRRKSALITGYYCSYFEKFINLQMHRRHFVIVLVRHLIFKTAVLLRHASLKGVLWYFGVDIFCVNAVFRWFKFTLKPPYSGVHERSLLAIWDTSHWNFFVKFGLRTAWDISYHILLSLLKFVNFWRLQGRLSILAKIGCLQKIKVFLMKEQWGFNAT